jgi:DNA polymerase-3 subunit chi
MTHQNDYAEVALYQLTTHTLQQILPRILEKIYGSGMRALVVTDCQERLVSLNTTLWTYSPGAFLPHGMAGSADKPRDNPIWLTLDTVNSNQATVLVLTGGRSVDDLSGYTRCVDIFDGNDPTALAAAHTRRDYYRKNGHSVVYWQQSPKGTWDKVEEDPS